MTPAQHIDSRGRQRVIVMLKKNNDSDKVFEALKALENLDWKGVLNFDEITHEDFYKTDTLIVEHEFLHALRGTGAATFKKLSRHASVIIALSSLHLLEASDVLPLGDAWLFTDYAFDHLPEVITLSQAGYTVLPTHWGMTHNLGFIRNRIFDLLSSNERQVLAMLSGGLTNAKAATRLGISEAQVKVIVRAIMRKMHFRNRTEAAIFMALREK